MKFKHFLIICLSIGLPLFALAQNPGRITGSVGDENGKLPGATISIAAAKIFSASDLDGNFSIGNIPPGSYTLVISFVGYKNLEKEFRVGSGESLDLGLLTFSAADNTLLDAVVVRGSMAPSQAKAYSIQRNALGIMNVIASDNIGKLPDRNAAEAVQRMPGVSIERDHGEGRYVSVRGTPLQWNSTLINGNRMPTSEGTSDNSSGTRTSPLDIFPSEMIEYVQLSKAITPDMEGDAIGGSVNFITRTAPKSQTLRIAGGGGYNNQAQKGVYNGSLLYGNTFFDGKFGFMLAGSVWERNWGTDNLEMVYNMDNHAVESLELRDYLGVRRTQGLNLGMEYNITPDNKIFFRGISTDFKDDETAYEHTFLFSENSFNLRRRRGTVGINLLGGEFGGIHESESGRWKLDWKGSTYSTRMNTRQPNGKGNGTYQLTMFNAPAQYGGLAPDGNKYLDIDSPPGYQGDNYTKILPYLNQEIIPGNLNLSQVIDIRMASYERDWVGELNLEHRPSDKLTVKAGGKYRAKYLERGSPMNINVYLGGYMGIPNPLTQYDLQDFPAKGGFLTELGEHYAPVLLPNITLDQLAAIHAKDYSEDPLWMVLNQDETNPASAASFYTGNENVTAGYAMGTYRFTPRFSVVGGLRYEHTFLKYNGNEVVSDESGDEVNPVSKNSHFGALLPMVHFRYSPQERFNLRLAYTRTFARANFADLNPTESISYLTVPASISRGNIDLKPTFSNNFDLLGEYFFKDIGILNAGIFYKALENVIYTARSFQTIEGTRYRISQPENSEKGWLFGVEAGLSKRLSFLPGFWGGFGVEGNYTFTRSEMDVPAYSEDAGGNIIVTRTKEALPSQPKHVFNTAVFYENEKLMIRVAGNYKGAALAVVQGNPENYRWYDKNFTVDLSASYKVSRKINLFLELNNLTNEPMKYYQGNSSRPEQIEYYSLRGSAGVNLNIF